MKNTKKKIFTLLGISSITSVPLITISCFNSKITKKSIQEETIEIKKEIENKIEDFFKNKKNLIPSLITNFKEIALPKKLKNNNVKINFKSIGFKDNEGTLKIDYEIILINEEKKEYSITEIKEIKGFQTLDNIVNKINKEINKFHFEELVDKNLLLEDLFFESEKYKLMSKIKTKLNLDNKINLARFIYDSNELEGKLEIQFKLETEYGISKKNIKIQLNGWTKASDSKKKIIEELDYFINNISLKEEDFKFDKTKSNIEIKKDEIKSIIEKIIKNEKNIKLFSLIINRDHDKKIIINFKVEKELNGKHIISTKTKEIIIDGFKSNIENNEENYKLTREKEINALNDELEKIEINISEENKQQSIHAFLGANEIATIKSYINLKQGIEIENIILTKEDDKGAIIISFKLSKMIGNEKIFSNEKKLTINGFLTKNMIQETLNKKVEEIKKIFISEKLKVFELDKLASVHLDKKSTIEKIIVGTLGFEITIKTLELKADDSKGELSIILELRVKFGNKDITSNKITINKDGFAKNKSN